MATILPWKEVNVFTATDPAKSPRFHLACRTRPLIVCFRWPREATQIEDLRSSHAGNTLYRVPDAKIDTASVLGSKDVTVQKRARFPWGQPTPQLHHTQLAQAAALPFARGCHCACCEWGGLGSHSPPSLGVGGHDFGMSQATSSSWGGLEDHCC